MAKFYPSIQSLKCLLDVQSSFCKIVSTLDYHEVFLSIFYFRGAGLLTKKS